MYTQIMFPEPVKRIFACSLSASLGLMCSWKFWTIYLLTLITIWLDHQRCTCEWI